MVVDRSGVLYDISKDYNIVFVKYHKKYFYCDGIFKGKINMEFN